MFKNIYEVERNISALIENDNNCSAHFNYIMSPNTCQLDLITYNPAHQTHFLLHSLSGCTKLDTVRQMYDFLFTLKQTLEQKNCPLLNYTIQWYCNASEKTFISSFYICKKKVD